MFYFPACALLLFSIARHRKIHEVFVIKPYNIGFFDKYYSKPGVFTKHYYPSNCQFLRQGLLLK